MRKCVICNQFINWWVAVIHDVIQKLFLFTFAMALLSYHMISPVINLLQNQCAYRSISGMAHAVLLFMAADATLDFTSYLKKVYKEVNKLCPDQNGRHLADDIFVWICSTKMVLFWLKFYWYLHWGFQIAEELLLLWIMACRRKIRSQCQN